MSQLPPSSVQDCVVSEFDPQLQPVVDVGPSQALHRQTLQLDFIRRAFSQEHDWHVDPLVAEPEPETRHARALLRRAAVFMPLVQRGSGLHVMFTRRADHLSEHAGQICFPGGRIEASDQDAVAAALRETHEEIGIGPEYVQLMGLQPAFITTTRFVMEPVVGVLKPGFHVMPDANEVAEVFEVPLPVLMDPALHRLHRIQTSAGASRHYFSMQWQSHFIWGATAALVRNFYRFLLAAQNGSAPLQPAAASGPAGSVSPADSISSTGSTGSAGSTGAGHADLPARFSKTTRSRDM